MHSSSGLPYCPLLCGHRNLGKTLTLLFCSSGPTADNGTYCIKTWWGWSKMFCAKNSDWKFLNKYQPLLSLQNTPHGCYLSHGETKRTFLVPVLKAHGDLPQFPAVLLPSASPSWVEAGEGILGFTELHHKPDLGRVNQPMAPGSWRQCCLHGERKFGEHITQ